MRISVYKDDKQHVLEVSAICRVDNVISVESNSLGQLKIVTDTADTADEYVTCLTAKGYCFIDAQFPAVPLDKGSKFNYSVFNLDSMAFGEYRNMFIKLPVVEIRKMSASHPNVVKALVFDDYARAKDIGRVEFDAAMLGIDLSGGKPASVKHYITLIKRTWKKIEKNLGEELQENWPREYTACESGDFSMLEDKHRAILAGLWYLGGESK